MISIVDYTKIKFAMLLFIIFNCHLVQFINSVHEGIKITNGLPEFTTVLNRLGAVGPIEILDTHIESGRFSTIGPCNRRLLRGLVGRCLQLPPLKTFPPSHANGINKLNQMAIKNYEQKHGKFNFSSKSCIRS